MKLFKNFKKERKFEKPISYNEENLREEKSLIFCAAKKKLYENDFR